jgi:hypothetical protein
MIGDTMFDIFTTFFLSLLTSTSPLSNQNDSKVTSIQAEVARFFESSQNSAKPTEKPLDFKLTPGGGSEGVPTIKQNTGKVRSEESYAGGSLSKSGGEQRIPEATQSYSQSPLTSFTAPMSVTPSVGSDQQGTSHASSPRSASVPSSYETGSPSSSESAPIGNLGGSGSGSGGGTGYSAGTSDSGSSMQVENEMTGSLTPEQMTAIEKSKANARDPEEITVTPKQVAEVEAKFKKMEEELQQAKKASSIPVVTPTQIINVPSVAPSQVTNVPGVTPSQVTNVPGVAPSQVTNVPGVAPSQVTNVPGVTPSQVTNVPGVTPSQVTNVPGDTPSQVDAPPPPPGFGPPPPSLSSPSKKPLNLGSSPRLYDSKVTTPPQKKGVTSGVSAQSNTTNTEIPQAAKNLGFDLKKPYKDEIEARNELRLKFNGKSQKIITLLETIDPNKNFEEYKKLSLENDVLESQQKILQEFLRKKYDPNPSKEDVEAAKNLGFDLKELYKDEREARNELRLKFNGKSQKLITLLETIDPNKNFEEYKKLSLENDVLESQQKILQEFLRKKYSQAQKKVVKAGKSTPSTGDARADLLRIVASRIDDSTEKDNTEKEQTPEEIENELKNFKKKVEELDQQNLELLNSVKPTDLPLVKLENRQQRNKIKEEKEILEKKIEERKNKILKMSSKPKTSQGTTNVQYVIKKVDPEQQQKQAKVVEEFKSSHSELAPFLDLLMPAQQTAFLKATVQVHYNMDGDYPTILDNDKVKVVLREHNITVREIPLDYMLSRLTHNQRASLLENIESRKDDDLNSQSKMRFNAVKELCNYRRLAQFIFPKWTEELNDIVEKAKQTRYAPVGSSAPVNKKEEEPKSKEKTSSVSVLPNNPSIGVTHLSQEEMRKSRLKKTNSRPRTLKFGGGPKNTDLDNK